MIVWVASYPRSGNTFFRLLLNRLYGVSTCSAYRVDGTADRVGGSLIGAHNRKACLCQLRASDQLHFVKTHRLVDAAHPEDRAIYLARDGRDALVSSVRLAAEADLHRASGSTPWMIAGLNQNGTFERRLEIAVRSVGYRASGTWADNVITWLRKPRDSPLAVVYYENLISDPVGVLRNAVSIVAPELTPMNCGTEIPTFHELHQADSGFFRRGVPGSNRDEMVDWIQALFWSNPDNAAAMSLLGYPKRSEPA